MARKKPKRIPPLNLTEAEKVKAQNLPVGCIDICETCDGAGRTRRVLEEVVFARTEQPGFAQDFDAVTLHVWQICPACLGRKTVECE